MRTSCFFITGILCLIFSIQTLFAQSLNTRISLRVKDATLPQVIQQIQKKYGYRFSYLNNELPSNTRVSADIIDKPLSDVLDALLEKTDIGYRESNGQIILKKGFPKNKPKPATFKKLPPVTTESKPRQTIKTTQDAPTKETETAKAVSTEEKRDGSEQTSAENNQTVSNTFSADENVSFETERQPSKFETFIENLKAGNKNRPDVYTDDSLLISPYHFGIFYPYSTNGKDAFKYVNRGSGHLFVGSAAGLEGFEFSGIGNIEKCYVNGGQFAGVFNIVQYKPTGRKTLTLLNGGNAVNGAQFAGFMNIVQGKVNGPQFAGFMNLSKKSHGSQVAGFMNLSKDVNGAQIAGFMNNADTISGSQVAGFLNKARVLKGAQLGFINIADSSSGVSIGLINLVKKGGYKRFEAYAADDFDANIAYKLGTQKFYTMIGLGAQLNDKRRWGYSFGFGSEWSVARHFRINTDIMSYYVIENSYKDFPDGLFENYELNLLNKFRLLGTLQITNHLALFGGPVYNVFVSRFHEPGAEEPGSGLVTHSFYNHTAENGTNVKMYIGFNAGIRF